MFRQQTEEKPEVDNIKTDERDKHNTLTSCATVAT